MRLIDHLADLALRQLGGRGAPLLHLLSDRSAGRGKRLLAAVHLACRRAWLAFELALAGPSLHSQLQAASTPADVSAGLRAFLEAFPLPEFQNRAHFRQQCLDEVHEARRRNLLTGDRLSEEEVEHKAAEMSQEPRPLAALQVEWRAQDGMAGELEQHGFTALPWLLRERPDGSPPLLLTAMRFLFCRVVEEDPELGPVVAFPRREVLPTAPAAGLAALHAVLRNQTRQVEGLCLASPATANLDALPEVIAVEEEPEESAETHFEAYQEALRSGRYDAALAQLHEALDSDPERFAPFPIDDYDPVQIRRAGGFDVTFVCRARALGGKVLVKAWSVEEAGRAVVANAFREAITLHQLHHPGILRLHRWGYADADKTRPYVVMENFTGQTLQEYIAENGTLSFVEFKELARQVADALRSAHRRGVLHRVVNPATLLLRRREREDSGMWEVRLVDFGLAVELTAPESPAAAGALEYAAPEQLGRLPSVEPGPPADVYGFARTCCYALFRTAHPAAEDWQRVSPSLAELLRDCLVEHPESRLPDFEAVLARLAVVRSGGRAAPKTSPASAPPRLVVLHGLRLHAEYVLHEGGNFIGRDAGGATLAVDLEDQEPDGCVLSSRRHALVTWKAGQLTITDLHSANGTLVNRAELTPGEEYPLADQDLIQVGSVLLQVLLEG
jgi:hypothetical protein